MHAPSVGTAGTKALKWEWADAGRHGRSWADLGRWKVPVALGSWRVDAREWEWDSDVLEYKMISCSS